MSLFKVVVLEVGTEEELNHWIDGYVPRRGETISFDYRGNWKVMEVTYRVIEPIAAKYDKPGDSARGVAGVVAFVYVEKM